MVFPPVNVECGELTIIIRKADAEMSLLDLFLENVCLIEEKNNGSGSKVSVVADVVEQVQTLVHAILRREMGPKRPFQHHQVSGFPLS